MNVRTSVYSCLFVESEILKLSAINSNNRTGSINSHQAEIKKL